MNPKSIVGDRVRVGSHATGPHRMMMGHGGVGQESIDGGVAPHARPRKELTLTPFVEWRRTSHLPRDPKARTKRTTVLVRPEIIRVDDWGVIEVRSGQRDATPAFGVGEPAHQRITLANCGRGEPLGNHGEDHAGDHRVGHPCRPSWLRRMKVHERFGMLQLRRLDGPSRLENETGR